MLLTATAAWKIKSKANKKKCLHVINKRRSEYRLNKAQRTLTLRYLFQGGNVVFFAWIFRASP